MNLPYTFALLTAASRKPLGFFRLDGVQADRQVRWMAAVGLVEATFDDGLPGSFTAIHRVLEAGDAFLRAFGGVHFAPGDEVDEACLHALAAH